MVPKRDAMAGPSCVASRCLAAPAAAAGTSTMVAMELLSPGLWAVAVTTAAAAASLSVFGAVRRRGKGWPWWLGATWAVAAALVIAPAGTGSRWLALLAELLLLQWPLACLVGVRRFHGRLHLPGESHLDLAVAAGAAAVLLVGSAWPSDSGPYALAPAAAALAAHLYVASVLFSGPASPEGNLLRGWGVLIAAGAALPVLWSLFTLDGLPSLAPRALATAIAAMVSAFIVIALVCDRTERQLRDSRRRLRWLANIDALTNVPNRRHFVELASRALASDPPGSAALVLFDVDHFKLVNDRHGHAAGDRALRLVARCVQDVLRTNDVPGRQGGDEFVLLLRRANTQEALTVANRIVTQLQRLAEGAGLPKLSLSFGVVHLNRGEVLDDALRRADQALYEAKRQGRSRAVAATGEEQRPVFTDSKSLGLRAV